MDFVNDFIHETYLQAFGWTLIHSIWQVVLVSVLLWIVLRAIPPKASNIRYWAGLSALLIILVASGITFSYMLESSAPSTTTPTVTAAASETGHHLTIHANDEANTFVTAPKKGVFDQPWLAGLEKFLPTLVNLWLLGALFFLLKLSGGLLDLRNLHKRHRQSVADPLLKKVNGMIAALGFYRGVQVLKSELIHVPVTYGFLKPVILIPASLLLHTPPRQLEAIIAHELAHIKRYDYLINIVQRIMEVFFFFHPCFWWINELIDTEREHACDDMVLSLGYSPGELARGLAGVAEQAQSAMPEMALAATGNPHHFLNRIKRILGKEQNKEKISPLITLTMLLSLMVSASLVMGAIPTKNTLLDDHYLLTKVNSQYAYKITIPPSNVDPCDKVVIKDTENHQASKNVSTTKTYVYRHTYRTDTTPAPKVTVKAPTYTAAPPDDPMPVLQLSPMPPMDVAIPPFPTVPPFEDMNFAPPTPDFQLDINEEALEISKLSMKMSQLEDDNSEEAEQQRKALQAKLEAVQEKMEAKAEVYEQKMEAWEEKYAAKMEAWEKKMEAWGEEMEAKQSKWEAAYEPKMKAFEQKIDAWEKENEPKIKEFEAKMEAWQERQRERQEKSNP
ncbi:M56 family metallopeptidase [Echinicola vietnamensis]|uniref:Antirepressor regulating drug resistance protein n=1 Tax=Echinicola vietnamensis (strain DSM 17526 / LMG 23754 / KMM 6221) TaxID=926556 RepID=L0FZR4_ECHVK|nr:M56 family metallopeptidase [Echinicola vietnamensis]AGA78256.1 antirepressor regulating drug resistance protein [Echinicola vietnamensis DSM 17526]